MALGAAQPPGAAHFPDDLFAALADPTRRAIFRLLLAQPMPVKLIVAELPVSQPAVSQHVKILKAAGLLTEKREGRYRIYAADPIALDRLSMQISHLRDDLLAIRSGGGSPRGAGFDSVDRAMSEWSDAWPEQDTFAVGLLLRIRLISRHTEALSARIAARHRLNGAQLGLMVTLDRLPPPRESTLTELSRISFTSLPTTARNLERIEKRGLVTSRPNANDGRSNLIRLTEKGRKLLHDALRSLREVQHEAVYRMAREDQVALVKHLRPLLRYMQESPEAPR